MSAKTSGADAGANGGGTSRKREHNQGNQERKCTPEQKAAVLRIRRCQATAFYEILDLEAVRKTCSDADIKKAYRKQSLLTHPDKNGHEHADEAFKMVSRAFGVLGDKEKRDKYDRFGTDPDSRFAGQQQGNPFSSFANRGAGAGTGAGRRRGGGMFGEEEISPEEMFARFFGGGFGGGAFDTGPQFVFNFGGGPGVRVHQFGGDRPRGRPRNPDRPEDTNFSSTLLGLVSILILFVFPLLSSLFSSATGAPATPRMFFDAPAPPYTHERTIPAYNVKYYVRPEDVSKWTSHSHLNKLDQRAQIKFVNTLNERCERERVRKQQMTEEAQGWFFQDQVKMEQARTMEMPNCERLRSLA